ncbi:hypothetical protein KIN20_002637 [Parelaphostrongylus tenuis]|uniref:Uncharacterized protein n=1 Tax=Parelaphostrongylus tenuis TaxID=148309 RepID=A0AAD5LVJ0_PARTN|nr:hypothetical protein KIN20_002637 [Parelaphostrongylus tenuis]
MDAVLCTGYTNMSPPDEVIEAPCLAYQLVLKESIPSKKERSGGYLSLGKLRFNICIGQAINSLQELYMQLLCIELNHSKRNNFDRVLIGTSLGQPPYLMTKPL